MGNVRHFYSRASCEARRSESEVKMAGETISTHAPLARRDQQVFCNDHEVIHFYSRASCEARRLDFPNGSKIIFNFYSRASCEARLSDPTVQRAQRNFYSRASCEARLKEYQDYINSYNISTHAPLARRDCVIFRTHRAVLYFYSRASCEARRFSYHVVSFSFKFLLTRLLRGATYYGQSP